MHKPAVAIKEHPASSNEIEPGFEGVFNSNNPYQQVSITDKMIKNR